MYMISYDNHTIWFIINTVKPVNKGHPRERQTMVFIDKWSLFGDYFVLFYQGIKGLGYWSEAFIYRGDHFDLSFVYFTPFSTTVFQLFKRAVSYLSFQESTSTRLLSSAPCYQSISQGSNPHQRDYWVRSQGLLTTWPRRLPVIKVLLYLLFPSRIIAYIFTNVMSCYRQN